MESFPSPDPESPRPPGEKLEDEPVGHARPAEDASRARSPLELLRGRSPRHILDQLVDADPLELGRRASEAIREQALLVDPERLFHRAAAHAAFEARHYGGDPPLDEWLAAHVAGSLREIVREDRAEDQSGLPPRDGWDPSHLDLGASLGCEPAVARSLCVVFNGLPKGKRRIFSAIVIQGRSIDDYAKECGKDPDDVRFVLKEVFTTLALLGQDPDAIGGRG
jgi:hypothetical protein